MILRYTVVTVIGMASLVVASLSLLLLIWVADREEPAVVEKVWLEPSIVKACDPVKVWVRRYKLRASGVHVERIMTDETHERVQLPKTDLDENPGPYGDFEYYTTQTVPCSLGPGWVEYNATTTYFRNPIQEFIWPIPGGKWNVKFCVTDGVQPSEQVCKTRPRS